MRCLFVSVDATIRTRSSLNVIHYAQFSIYIYVGRPSLMVIGVDLNPHSQGMLEE